MRAYAAALPRTSERHRYALSLSLSAPSRSRRARAGSTGRPGTLLWKQGSRAPSRTLTRPRRPRWWQAYGRMLSAGTGPLGEGEEEAAVDPEELTVLRRIAVTLAACEDGGSSRNGHAHTLSCCPSPPLPHPVRIEIIAQVLYFFIVVWLGYK